MNENKDKAIKSDINYGNIYGFWDKSEEDVVFREETLTEEATPAVAAVKAGETVGEDVCRLQGRLEKIEKQLQKMRVIIGAQRIEEEKQEAKMEETMALCVPPREKIDLWQSIKRLLRELLFS